MKLSKINGLEITVCGLNELRAYNDVTHVISIWNGGDRENPRTQVEGIFPQAAIHFAYFNDVTDPDASYPPTQETVRDVLSFTQTLGTGCRLLIHCAAGISRSTALAYAVICQHWGADLEIEAFVELKWLRPQACPNALVVALSDELLGRNGAMRDATRL